jgi:hypothetical protein
LKSLLLNIFVCEFIEEWDARDVKEPQERLIVIAISTNYLISIFIFRRCRRYRYRSLLYTRISWRPLFFLDNNGDNGYC